jgi:hypothetical protein
MWLQASMPSLHNQRSRTSPTIAKHLGVITLTTSKSFIATMRDQFLSLLTVQVPTALIIQTKGAKFNRIQSLPLGWSEKVQLMHLSTWRTLCVHAHNPSSPLICEQRASKTAPWLTSPCQIAQQVRTHIPPLPLATNIHLETDSQASILGHALRLGNIHMPSMLNKLIQLLLHLKLNHLG